MNVNLANNFFLIYAFILLFVGIFGELFWIQMQRERRSLRIGLFFNLTVLFMIMALSIFIILYQNQLVITLWVGISWFVTHILPFIIEFFLIMYAIQIFKKESHSISNLLLPIFLIFQLFLFIYLQLTNNIQNELLVIINDYFFIVLLYFSIVFLNFFSSSFIYRFFPPKIKTNYIAVLGSGLINGRKVGKLLSLRIEKAVLFANKKIKDFKIIFSGGKGRDEKISEANAMQNYAIEKLSIPASKTILENKSTTTEENLKFTNQLVNNHPFYFVSNSYHIFRAGLLAKKMGIDAQGIGGRTPAYYLPSAFLREFIAIIVMNRKKHIINLLILTLLFLIALTFVYILMPN